MQEIEVTGDEPAIVSGHTPPLAVTLRVGVPIAGVPVMEVNPVQVAGLLPLKPCDETECREICPDGIKHTVFGEKLGVSFQQGQTYENDWSSFMIDVSIFKANPTTVTVTMFLEKFYQGQWRPSPFAPNLNDNIYGQYFGLGDVPGHPSYAGYQINWGSVMNTFGIGCYRFRVETSFTTVTLSDLGEPMPTVHEGCLVSPVFDVKMWNCFVAHGTVKFETWLTGLIGDPYEDYKKHDLCGVLWYDSIRVGGFIHYAKSPEYLTNNLEWGAPNDGKIEKVSDEQIQRWQYNSRYLPEYVHTRFATFAMMSDLMFASDYNINNSDWTLKRRNFIYDSGYEPESIDKTAYWQRRNKLNVEVFFKRGVQSVIKSLCCPTRDG